MVGIISSQRIMKAPGQGYSIFRLGRQEPQRVAEE